MTAVPTSAFPARRSDDLPALACVWLLMVSSSLVFIEPAPFDLAFIAMFGIAMIAGLRFPKVAAPMLIMLVVWFVFSLIGTSQAKNIEYYEDTFRHVLITGLLIGVAMFFASLVYRYQERALVVIMNGWVVAALIASVAGILAYFDVLGGLSEKFLLYGRAKGTFKDPNVFAPFLVPPILYCVYRAASRPILLSLIDLAVLGVLTVALLLSFSRGGWLNLVVSGLAAVFLWFLTSQDSRFKIRLVAFMIIAAAVLSMGLVKLLSLDGVGEFFSQRFAIQDYDSSAHGRFAGQYLTFMKALDYPLGLGAHGFLPDWYEQPHNVYLFQMIIGGWGGGLAYLFFVIITMAKSVAFLQRSTPYSNWMVVLSASFIGLAVEGVFVDSDHWRHFWILTGSIWGLCALTAPPSARTTVSFR